MSAAFRDYCDALLTKARDAHWRVVTDKTIPYGHQYHLTDAGGAKAVLNCYDGKKGMKFVVGGRDGERLGEDLGAEKAPTATGTGASDDPFNAGLPRIGADESGKGDYFGPLTVGAVRVTSETLPKLLALGVQDSKNLRDKAILRMAGKIEELGIAATRVLMPRDYNAQYAGNVNETLAALHVECIQSLEPMPTETVVVDQFARNSVILKRAIRKLVTRTKGEADPAVAAASILARAAFLDGLRELESEHAVDLPPGAGSPVLKAGREFVRTFGADALVNVAKLHFRTTGQIS